MSSLIELDFSNNLFLEFPKPIISIPKLDHLRFDQSEGHKVPALPNEIEFTNVRHLILSNNTLRCLPNTISSLKQLVSLVADHNEIQTLPNSICGMRQLKVLHLNDNKITSLPENMDSLTELKELRLHNNPLRTPPMDVCVSGVIQPIGRFIRRALEREGNILQFHRQLDFIWFL